MARSTGWRLRRTDLQLAWKGISTRFDKSSEFGTQRRVQGRQAWVDIWQGWRQAFPDVKGTVQNVFVSGNQAVAEVTWDGTLQGDFVGPGGTISANGKRMQDLHTAFVYTAEGAKLKEVNVYFEIAGLIQQISP